MSIASVLSPSTIVPSSQVDKGDQTAEEIAKEKAQKEKVDFLNILLTQLSNQNPLDPMDTKDFTAQLTRYSILEQGIDTNEKLAVTNELLKTSANVATFDYIGKDVEVVTNIGAVQDGGASWSYIVEGSPSDVILTVTDADGNQVLETEGSIALGAQSFSLNAADYGLSDGQELYLSIAATDSNDAKLNTQTTANLTVDGVWSDGTNSYLTAGDISFRATDVLKLAEAVQEDTNI